MKKLLTFLLLFFTIGVIDSYGSHLMGGEITWICQRTGANAGKFKFTVKLYRDCNGITAPPSVTLTSNAPGLGAGVLCNQVSTLDLSPVGPGCPTCANPGGRPNAVLECIYESAFINITGVPPATGWYFAYFDCCRNGAITNLSNAGSGNFTLRALMFPYNATNTNPCYDTSPRFAERPQLATMIGNLTTYSANAVDEDGDSLHYDWGQPLDGTVYPGGNYPFAAGYTYQTPLPNPAQNPLNQSAILDPNSGTVTFTPFTVGSYVTVTKVSSFRCGIKIAEVYREIQISLLASVNVANNVGVIVGNTPPDIDPVVLPPTFQVYGVNQFVDTVFAGDTIKLPITAYDFEHVTTNAASAFQSVSFDVTGIELDATETANTGGCPFPPCAYVDKAVPTPYSPAAASIQFTWVTDCNHLAKTVGCISLKNTYNFVVKALDNFCPSPSVNFYTFSIVVVAPPEMDPSLLYCADVQTNGNVTLTWDIPTDTGVVDTNKYFQKHYVYRSVAGGPYTLIDSVSVITDLTFTDLTANANTGSISYYLETKSGCDLRPRQQSDTISTMYLQVSQVGTNASLTWNPLDVPNPPGSHSKYYIYKETSPGSGSFTLLDSTANTTYLDPVTVCNDSINYYIRLHNDIRNCDSKSNINGAQLQAAAPVINPPSLRCVSVLPNEDIQISWVGTTDTASYFSSYEIYHSLNLAGPYTLVGSVTNYAANTFTHVGAQGNSQPHYYHVTTKAGCDATTVTESTTTSDNLCSMKLNLNNATVGFADLTWNAIKTPLPITSTGLYSVYRRVSPTVAWSLRGTTANLTFRDTVTLCDTIIEYKVTIADASGCISTSSDSAARFTSQGDIIANPSLRCLAVQANGDVQLSWLAPSDPDNFFSKYEVYSATNAAGPFVLVGTVSTYNAGGFLHTGAGANTGSRYYYVKSLSGCTGLADNGSTSDTLKTMYLTVNNATLGSAILTWNAMHNPALPSAAATYTIKKRATGIGGYTLVGTTSNLTYTDNINVCNDPIEYIVELTDNAPCTSVSNAANDVFTYLGNVIVNPDLRCVSVQNNGQIILSFIPPAGASTNFNEYEIWRDNGTGFVKYDSVSTFGAVNYTDINANGNNQSYSYYMLSQSGCTGQVNSLTNSQSLSSIYLTTTPVLGQANLNWTGLAATIPATSTTGQYDIYSSYNVGGALQLYGDTNKLVYSQPIVNCDTTLRYQIKLVDNSGCVSTSNIDTNDYTYIGNIINNPDLRCVSVQNNGQIVLNYLAPSGSSADFNEYEIWRDNGTGYVKYDSISTFANGTYTDINANGNAQSYGYYMLTQSGCTGQVNSVTNSQSLNSIYLTTTPVLGQANLNWTALSTPIPATSTTGQYDVYSSYNALGNLQLYGDTNKLLYFQPISNCDTTLRYQIKLVDNSGCISTSNIDTNDYTYIGNVINNPDLRCVSVQNNGQIVLNYLAPSGSSADFNEYEIWRDNGAGYVKYDSVSTFANGTYTDINANGNNQSYGYYMLTQSGCTGQVNSASNSQSLNSIYLTTTPVLGQANLNWTALSTPIPATSTTGQYDVYSSYNASGNLQLYGDTNQLVYFQPITNCDTTLRYQIKLVDNSGCISTSNVDTNDYTYIGNVINNPDLRCVSVQNNGQILLNFIPPVGSSADFNEYEIWRDNGAGYVKYDSISNIAATTYTDINANGNNQSYGYYMLTQSGCTGQVNSASNSQSLNSIYLTTTPVLGQANLNWTALSTPLPATSTTGQYDVYSSYNAGGSLQLYGDTNQLLYFQPISNCDTTLRYQIKLVDNSGCISTSNVDTNDYTYIGNVINNPDLRCVSVQNNGQILLNFIPPAGSSADFNEFEIWRDNGAGYVKYDSISNIGATTYTDINANGNNQSYGYYMLTQSGCTGQVNSASNSQSLNSIYLTTTPVLGQANLNWTALSTPIPATSTTGQYDVYSSYNAGGNLQLYGDTNQLVYFQPITNCDTTLRYQIKLVDNSGCISTSNVDTNDYTYIGNVINNPDLRCVSVQNNGQILLNFIPPVGSSVDFNEYEIWRDNGAGYVKYDSISNYAATTYTDINANGNNQSYGYYMLTQSGCTGQVNSASNSQSLNSIYLTTTPVLGTANLNWTALSTPLPGTSVTGQYDIFTSYNAAGNLQILGDTNQLVYFEGINNCDTTLRHQVKVNDNSGCVSVSNVDTNLFTYIGNVINNPDLRCVSVLNNGQIELSFIPPSGSSVNFNEYEIWRDNGAGYVKYDSVSTFGAVNYTDINANGNNQSYGYYMLTQSGCTGQVNSTSNSQSLNSIYLTTTPVLGTANLNWTALASPLPGSSTTGQYDIYSSYNPAGTLQLYGDTAQLVYSQPIQNCDTTLRYQIKVVDNSGCISTSNVDTNLYTYIGNVINNPEMRCVTVNSPSGQTQLTWVNPTPTSWINFNQYNVYRNTGSGFTLVDSVQSNGITSYTDVNANGYNGSVSYYLVTKSGCTGQVDNGTLGNTISSLYLKVTGGNTSTATLNWNAPSSPLLPSSSGSYLVERQQPAGTGTWTTAGNVTATTFTEPLTLCIDSVNYRVSINDNIGCTSMSNYDGETFVDHTIPVSPSLRCASVQTNGDVVLNWVAPVDTGMKFGSYLIYSSNNVNGPFNAIQNITNYNTTTYTHVGANAQNQNVYYYILTKTACGGEVSPVSDTLKTMKVNVINNNGVAVIRWNPLHDPELSTATQTYNVHKEYPTGVWNVIGTTTAPDYIWYDTINVCSAIINYYVSTGDALGCGSNSSTDGDLFKDITKPTVSLLDTVSIDTSTQSIVSISWLPSPSGDVEGYILYHFNGASWDSIGAVYGINANSFQITDPSVQSGPQLYSITAYDSCLNRSNIGSAHSTLFLKAKLDVCKYAIDLQWNPYINMVGGVAQYNVFASENGGPFTLIASVPSNNITYSHNTLNNGSYYCYYIQAVGNVSGRTSTSTRACATADLLTLPTYGYLRKATVIDDRRVLVTAYVDTTDQPDVSKYKLQRAFDKAGPFTTVGVQSYTGNPDLTFADFTARTDQYSYYYRLITVDSCGNEVLKSNMARTILLSGQARYNLTNELKFNDYSEWLGGVNNYALFRKVDDVWQTAPAAILPFGQQTYMDDVSSIYQTSGKFCYRIEAYEGAGNMYGYTDTSSSNEFCLIQEPHLFVPSAFTPGGKNTIFKPEYIYIDAKNYFFVVFNRWGQKVYESRVPGEGWNGEFDGKIAPEGTYVYTVRIFGTNGQEIEKSGSVTLLR